MCGFVGILVHPEKAIDRSLLRRMSDLIKHRGPDDFGEVILQTGTNDTIAFQGSIDPENNTKNHNLGMSFRRLAIIDLSNNAHQPMQSVGGRISLVFNGEIYNAEELKSRYLDSDYKFRGYSDTEVILALYEKLGEKTFGLLNGMFAIAIWDFTRKKVFLVRDRVGVKPLYYTLSQGSVAFSSEIKPLLHFLGPKRRFDSFGLLEYFTFQYCLEERTLFSGVFSLEPGTYIAFDTDYPGKIAKRVRYWDLEFRTEENRSLASFSEELRYVLSNVIKSQTRSDVPIGAFLSGGIDTGAIVSLAREHLKDLNTFTCGFNTAGLIGLEAHFDESVSAEELSAILGTHHNSITLDHSYLPSLLEDVIWHLEDPKVGICYQNFILAKKVKEFVTVVLSGTGGDELFAGYGWKYKTIFGEKDLIFSDQKYFSICSRLTQPENRWKLFSESLKRDTDSFDPVFSYERVMERCQDRDPIHRALYFDLKGFLPGLLMVEDKLNMAYSVEARVPFLDHQIIDLASRIPSKYKFDGENTKLVLKNALKGILPEETLSRRKQGFTPPEASWMRTKNLEYIESILFDPQFLELGLFKPEAISNIVNEHVRDIHNHRMIIWGLLSVAKVNKTLIQNEQL